MLGVLSLAFWALLIVVSFKYLVVVMRADNRAEGGILALTALLLPAAATARQRGRRRAFVLLGVFGAALLYGDGVIGADVSIAVDSVSDSQYLNRTRARCDELAVATAAVQRCRAALLRTR